MSDDDAISRAKRSVSGAIDAICERFEAAWESGQHPRIEDYLAEARTAGGPPTRELLMELVLIDLERRWRTARPQQGEPSSPGHETLSRHSSDALAERPLLEDYVRRFPELGSLDQLGEDLIAHEYRVRHLWGERPGHEEYLARFGGHRASLEEVLSKTDREMAAKAGPAQHGAKLAASAPPQPKALHVKCPHCQNPVEIVEDTPLVEIGCPSCGSSFNLVGDEALAYQTMGGTMHRRQAFSHFELIEQLGHGAFGAVWKARDTQLDRTVAVKIPRKGQLTQEESEKVLREARAAAQLRHPNIVSVHEVGLEDEVIFTVSDFIEGVSLHDWLTGRRFTHREAAELCAKIAEAIHFAHEHGVIHRDLKPSNIFSVFSF